MRSCFAVGYSCIIVHSCILLYILENGVMEADLLDTRSETRTPTRHDFGAAISGHINDKRVTFFVL